MTNSSELRSSIKRKASFSLRNSCLTWKTSIERNSGFLVYLFLQFVDSSIVLLFYQDRTNLDLDKV